MDECWTSPGFYEETLKHISNGTIRRWSRSDVKTHGPAWIWRSKLQLWRKKTALLSALHLTFKLQSMQSQASTAQNTNRCLVKERIVRDCLGSQITIPRDKAPGKRVTASQSCLQVNSGERWFKGQSRLNHADLIWNFAVNGIYNRARSLGTLFSSILSTCISHLTCISQHLLYISCCYFILP
jgi:hypothetical protein